MTCNCREDLCALGRSSTPLRSYSSGAATSSSHAPAKGSGRVRQWRPWMHSFNPFEAASGPPATCHLMWDASWPSNRSVNAASPGGAGIDQPKQANLQFSIGDLAIAKCIIMTHMVTHTEE